MRRRTHWPLAWSLLGSAWAHVSLVAAIALLARCAATSEEVARDVVDSSQRSLTLVELPPDRTAATGAAEAGGDGAPVDAAAADPGVSSPDRTGNPGPPPELRPLSREEIAALDAAALQTLDPALLDGLDPKVVEALLAGELPDVPLDADIALDDLDRELIEALARLRSRLVEAGVVPLEPSATSASGSLAHATSPSASAQGDPDVPLGTEDPGTDDAIAAIDAPDDREDRGDGDDGGDVPTLDDRDAPERSATEPDHATPARPEATRQRHDEVDPVEVPEAAKEDVEEASEPEWVEYVHAPDDAPTQATDEATTISTRDLRANFEARTRVLSQAEGQLTPQSQASLHAAGQPEFTPRTGEAAEKGGRNALDSDEEAEQSKATAGGGRKGQDRGAGSPGEAGQRMQASVRPVRSGGQASPAGGRAGASGQASGAPLTLVTAGAPASAARDGFKQGPRPDGNARVDATSWWNPRVVRVVTPREPANDPIAVAVVETSEPRPAKPAKLRPRPVAPIPSVDEETEVGGTDADDETEDAPPMTDPDPTEGESDDGYDLDPVEAFRRDLDWGDVDRSKLPDRRTVNATPGTAGTPESSPQVVLDDVPVSDIVFVSASDDPRGHYRARVDELITSRWTDQDLPVDLRAIGIQGRTIVVFKVKASGKVSELVLQASSGHPTLDRIAIESVPSRLPRFPKEIDADYLIHQVRFVYHNPIITPEQR